MISKVQVKASLGMVGRPGNEVLIDGEPLPGVRSVDVSTSPGFIPTVTVELETYELEVDGEVVVELPEKTVAALRKLGWTPPGEEGARV